MPTIILKDADGNPIYDAAEGRIVWEDVSDAVAAFLAENDRYIASQHDNDQRHFRLVHFDKQAWENLPELSSEFSAEDECLDVLEEVAAAEQALYQKRLALCRRLLPLVREACTETQWRRLLLHQLDGLSYRAIARMEGAHDKTIVESVHAAKKKIRIIFLKWA